MTDRTTALLLVSALVAACGGRTPSSDTPAQAGLDTLTSVRLVKEYVQRDAHGERLQTNPWFLNAVIWEDEPAFDSYTLITSYEITPIRADSSTARVEVVFRRAGYVRTTGDSTVAFHPDAAREVQVFTVALTFNGWRIVAPQLDQHVSVEAALDRSPLSSSDRAKVASLKERSSS